MSKENFFDRFPSVKPKQVEVDTVVAPSARRERISGLHVVLSSTLPLLRQHADFEPYTQPISVNRGLKKGLTGGWEFHAQHIERTPEGYHPSRTWRYILTEDGDIGVGEAKHGVIEVTDRVHRLSKRAIDNMFPEGGPPVQDAARNITGILSSVGVEITFPEIEE